MSKTNPTSPYVSAPSGQESSTALSQYSDPVRNPYTQEIPTSFCLKAKQAMSAYFFSAACPLDLFLIYQSHHRKKIKDKKTHPKALQPPALDSVVSW